MSRKVFAQVFILAVILPALLLPPINAQAGSAGCGTYYVVQQGETLDAIAANCGISVDVLIAGNAGIGDTVYPGEVLVIPGTETDNYYPAPTANPYSYYGPYNNSYNNTYIVQYGDTFADIANRFGVSVGTLAAANPQIWNIDLIFAGQMLSVPAPFAFGSGNPYATPWAGLPWYGYNYSYGPTPQPWWYASTPTPEPSVPLSYGKVPPGTPKSKITFSNKAQAQVYISLQGTTRAGDNIIDEYPVKGTMTVHEPVGWYNYVAYVGGRQFSGGFNLPRDSNLTITFYSDKIVVN